MFKSIAKWYNNLTEESNSDNHEETTKPSQPKYSILIQKNDYAYWLTDRYGMPLRKVMKTKRLYNCDIAIEQPNRVIGFSASRGKGFIYIRKDNNSWYSEKIYTGYTTEHFRMSYNSSRQGNRFQDYSTNDILCIRYSTTIFSEEECVYITERIQGEFGMFPLIKGEVG